MNAMRSTRINIAPAVQWIYGSMDLWLSCWTWLKIARARGCQWVPVGALKTASLKPCQAIARGVPSPPLRLNLSFRDFLEPRCPNYL
jgi:hypothetical protein